MWMWNFVSSVWSINKVAKENDLSLEDASSILENTRTEVEEIETVEKSKNAIGSNFLNRIGIITKQEGNSFIIDDLYKFKSETVHFNIGAKVSFDVLINNSEKIVLNVNLLDSDWDVTETKDSLWSTRVIVCKVEAQVNRTLILSPGEVNLDLNDVSLNFLPVVGDWVQLDVKCSINENSVNLAGEILQINEVLPLRPHIEIGKITMWDKNTETGVINRNIFLNKYSLSCGYVPVIGDKVVAEIIESDQNRCCWRALKVVPEENKRELERIQVINDLPEYLETYPGIEIEIPNLIFTKLNQTKNFEIILKNNAAESIKLLAINFLNDNGQCRIINNFDTGVEIVKDGIYEVNCEVVSKNIGLTNSILLFLFENFKIGKRAVISVVIDYEQPTNYQKGGNSVFYDATSENEVIKGRKVGMGPRFRSQYIPNYPVPRKLNEIFLKNNFQDPLKLMQELKMTEPYLFSNLSILNYADKFHALLYLEELTMLRMIKNYNKEKACFVPCEDYLLLEIENLSEKRPSIVIGDKIIASDPLNRNNVDFEGFVHKVGARHVFLKFSPLFHDRYNGEDYTVKVIPSRSTYRKLHHSVFLAGKVLGKEILFPTRVDEKPVQVEFYEANFEATSSRSNKRLSQVEVLRKLKEIRNSDCCDKNSSDANNKVNKLKLDWYNKNLNPKQKDSVKNVLLGKARPLPYIIFGPPGTGKTVTVIEMILQILRLIPQSRLLITAPSNSASDLIALRLIDSGVLKPGDLVRLVSYNYAISDSIPVKLVPYCATCSLARDGTAENEIVQTGIKFDCNRSTLGRHRITISTCSMAGQLYFVGFPKGHFTHIIVDEAGQASEPEVLIPLTFLDKFTGQAVLAGDPMQLGPVVQSQLAGEYGLNESFLERLIGRFPYQIDPKGFPETNGYDPRLVTKLLYNYRSLPLILKLTSSLFYNDELIATIDEKTSDEAKFLEKLSEILPKTNQDTTPQIVFHGVDGENFQSSDSPSWYNPHEAAQVFFYINELFRVGVNAGEIGIITPYIKQVKEIRSLLVEAEFDLPKIGTVEEFQGQEFKIVILSTVRSNKNYISTDLRHSLGFVTSPRRLNVATSRPKSLLVIIGNPNLLSMDIYWRSVLEHCLKHGCYIGCDLVS